jgi:GNAT superfamily N-acetyltransferase
MVEKENNPRIFTDADVESKNGGEPMRGVIGSYIQDRETTNQQNPKQTIVREAGSTFFILNIANSDGKQESHRFHIEVLDNPEHLLLPQAYELLAKKFGSEELDPLPIMQDQMKGLRYGYEMGTRAAIFAIQDEDGEVVCTLVGGLLPLRSEGGEMQEDSTFMVFYVATEDKFKRSGFGREIMIDAYEYAQTESKKRKLNLLGAAGECTWTSQNYWERLGWRRVYIDNGSGPIEEIHYVQPPLAFDLETGEAEDGAGDAPEHFMILLTDPNNGEDQTELKNRLASTVRAFYRSNNYIDQQAFNNASPKDAEAAEVAYERHISAIKRHEESFQQQLGKGTIKFYSKEELKKLRKEGREVVEFVTSEKERAARNTSTQNF